MVVDGSHSTSARSVHFGSEHTLLKTAAIILNLYLDYLKCRMMKITKEDVLKSVREKGFFLMAIGNMRGKICGSMLLNDEYLTVIIVGKTEGVNRREDERSNKETRD